MRNNNRSKYTSRFGVLLSRTITSDEIVNIMSLKEY